MAPKRNSLLSLLLRLHRQLESLLSASCCCCCCHRPLKLKQATFEAEVSAVAPGAYALSSLSSHQQPHSLLKPEPQMSTKNLFQNAKVKAFFFVSMPNLAVCFAFFMKEQREHFCQTLIPSSHFKTFINWDQNPSFQGSSRNSVSMIWQSSVLSQVGELLLQFYSQKLETLHVSPNVLLLRNCEIKKLRY